VESLGQIEKLLMENFKSYAGMFQIGPFDKFTCVIGPNGSGKSNVMDAISFCLGIRARHLRGDRLRDLVYRRENEDPETNPRKAKVALIFRTARGDVLHFGRNINAKGEGTYRYGSPGKVRSVGYDEFVQRLADEQIYVKARNFLVFQGDVMELARRQGQDLTGILETISGSDQLKDEYDRLSHELDVMQEKARMHFQHHREVENTVLLLGKQRADVERYHDLRKQRQQTLVEKMLFRLFCAECEANRDRELVVERRSALSGLEGELKTTRKQIEEDEARRKLAATEVDKAASLNYVLQSNIEQLKPEIANCKKRSSYLAKQLREKEEMIQEEVSKHGNWEATLKQMRTDRTHLEAEIVRLKSEKAYSALQLTDAQRVEYDQAVAQMDTLNVRNRERIRAVEEQLALCGRELEAHRLDLRDLQEKQDRSTARQKELGREQVQIERELEAETALLGQRKSQATAFETEVNKFKSFRDSLVEEQRSLQRKLDTVRARRETLEQVEARQRLADELRSAFSEGVIGRLSEVLLPSQKRFDLALQMSLGSNMEAFVVTDTAVGHACIRYLKERRIKEETFLTFDRMTSSSSNKSLVMLTHANQARRLATQCVQPNGNFLERNRRWQADGPRLIEATVQFLLGGTVFVDDLEEAKATAYSDARRYGVSPRVVTLDGEVISPNGNMSVQSVSSLGRVEFGSADQLHELRSLQEKLAGVERDLASLCEEMSRKSDLHDQLLEEVREAEARRSGREGRLTALAVEQATEQRLNNGRVHRIEELQARVQRGTLRRDELGKTVENLEAELLKVGKKYFERLNRELGVGDVREIARQEQRERRRIRSEIEQNEDVVRKLVSEEQALERRIAGTSKREALAKDREQYVRDTEAVNERREALEEKLSLYLAKQEEARARLEEVRVSNEQLEQAAKASKAAVQRLRAQADEAKKELKKETEKVRMCLSIRCGIFRDCDEQQVDVPLLINNDKDDAALEQIRSRELDLDDLPFDDLEKVCGNVQVDYTNLPANRKAIGTHTRIYDTKGTELEYEAQIDAMSRELEGLNPNLRAVEECSAEEAKLKDIKKQADEAAQTSSRLNREFEGVKSERIGLFMKCFKHVESFVNPYYKELTSYDGYEGGSAYLDLDDVEEPYNGGITFTACPPGKRFFPMELLSGGEKSMASMALLFAMHSFQPPPFMILDEVDAPFDRKNTNALVAYLKRLHFQCLVISLKDSFFAHSDGIIGIYKDKEEETSGFVALPLKKYEQASHEPETEVPRPIAFASVDMD